MDEPRTKSPRKRLREWPAGRMETMRSGNRSLEGLISRWESSAFSNVKKVISKGAEVFIGFGLWEVTGELGPSRCGGRSGTGMRGVRSTLDGIG